MFVPVVGADGTIFSQRDEQPDHPTSQWIADEMVVTTYTLATLPGSFTLRMGVYLQANGQRLTIRGAGGRGDIAWQAEQLPDFAQHNRFVGQYRAHNAGVLHFGERSMVLRRVCCASCAVATNLKCAHNG